MKKLISIFTLISAILLLLSTGCKKNEKPPDPVSDIDGNIYKTVKIGSQIWMTENLKTTTLNDGIAIPPVSDADSWFNTNTPGLCWYNNNAASFKDVYGALYNSFTISTGKLCPDGWHIPSNEEWDELSGFLGDSTSAGGKLKEAGTDHWLSPNTGADNKSGFTALPAGVRYLEGTFATVSSGTGFWSASEAGSNDEWYVSLYYGSAGISTGHRNKKHGFSVRCIKN